MQLLCLSNENVIEEVKKQPLLLIYDKGLK